MDSNEIKALSDAIEARSRDNAALVLKLEEMAMKFLQMFGEGAKPLLPIAVELFKEARKDQQESRKFRQEMEKAELELRKAEDRRSQERHDQEKVRVEAEIAELRARSRKEKGTF